MDNPDIAKESPDNGLIIPRITGDNDPTPKPMVNITPDADE